MEGSVRAPSQLQTPGLGNRAIIMWTSLQSLALKHDSEMAAGKQLVLKSHPVGFEVQTVSVPGPFLRPGTLTLNP